MRDECVGLNTNVMAPTAIDASKQNGKFSNENVPRNMITGNQDTTVTTLAFTTCSRCDAFTGSLPEFK